MDRQESPSLALLTDLYEITMAYGYWKAGVADREAAFVLFFRRNPFENGYTIACGLEQAIEFLERFRFSDDDLEYLRGIKGNDGKLLFEPAFLDYLKTLRLTLDIDAVPEGTVVFPQEPLLITQGPIVQCQLLETALLTIINFQTLIATKAARICQAAQGDPVIEFGLRRAQGIDGGISASRAAYVGGCIGTSNVLAGKIYGIPTMGTHAHSWVMLFDSEIEAFQAYADAMPNNCVFLVDTYDTIEGVRNAIEAGRRLRDNGHKLAGIRLDSGDLAYLSIEARRMLDEAGFTDTSIVASNELDENIIASLKQQGARINVWGVGTRLATAYDEPALGGIYKLTAIRKPGEPWQYRIKLSEQLAKITTPGIQRVRRFRDSLFIADMIYDAQRPPEGDCVIVDPMDITRRKRIAAGTPSEELLVPLLRGGKPVYPSPEIRAIRERAQQQLAMLHPGIKRFVNPHLYPVGLESNFHELKTSLILKARE
ncbi:nicotinate phosphoribosyltransferase [bacterium]|nr:nicotinate phosphoribosyltransferase [bacterium]